MGYKMKGPTFFGKSSPMKITSEGNTSMVNAYTKAVNAEAEAEAAMGKNMSEGVDNIASSAQDVVKAAKGVKSNKKSNNEESTMDLIKRLNVGKNKLADFGRTDDKRIAVNTKSSAIKKKCNCWDGYKRVKGTKPCAPGSCEKA
jgi:hypothetical protein